MKTMLQVTIFRHKEPSPPGAITARGEHSSCPGSPGIMLIGLKAPLEKPQKTETQLALLCWMGNARGTSTSHPHFSI